jgi:hypothetical protein
MQEVKWDGLENTCLGVMLVGHVNSGSKMHFAESNIIIGVIIHHPNNKQACCKT